ncbi:MAG: hypothetical protein LUG17_04850 [Clostridiales bacterium]|nr:hypothetical protein [Clostridiales bacterium]
MALLPDRMAGPRRLSDCRSLPLRQSAAAGRSLWGNTLPDGPECYQYF